MDERTPDTTSTLERLEKVFNKDPKNCSAYTQLILELNATPDQTGLGGIVLAETHRIAIGGDYPHWHDPGCLMYKPISQP